MLSPQPRTSGLLLGIVIVVLLLGVTACRSSQELTAPEDADWVAPVIPLPATIDLNPEAYFTLTPETTIFVDAGDAEAKRIAKRFARLLATTNAPAPPVEERAISNETDALPSSHIVLTRQQADANLGPEGYALTITTDGVTLRAPATAGLFYGVQTLRQLLPPYVEYGATLPRPLTVPTGRIVDTPRFEWRGAMLDVVRHFRTVDEVKRYIDLMALHKLNRLHLHLTDDQGWRLQIKAWPRLTEIGGRTEVGGGPGGYYTQDDYTEIVRYAAARHITVVPEIDMPGHTNAALVAIPELNCDGEAPPPHTGIEVGFSALCLDKDITYRFVDDVLREVAALTPGPYLHFGGDEATTLSEAEYATFVRRVEAMIARHGKQSIGWDEVALARDTTDVDATGQVPRSIVQWWRPSTAAEQAVADVAARGGRLIVSPADRFYLDMKYDTTTALGLQWAGVTSVEKAYEADPTTLLPDVPVSAILGVEAPLWAETTETMDDVEYLAFPRLAGVAEIGWSPPDALNWSRYRLRLGRQAARWTALGINFYRAPEVPWEQAGQQRPLRP